MNEFIYVYDLLTILLNLFVCVFLFGWIVFSNREFAASVKPHVGYFGSPLNQWNSAYICSGVSSPHSVNVWKSGKWSSIVNFMHGLENVGRLLRSADGFNGRDGTANDCLQMSAKPDLRIHFLLRTFSMALSGYYCCHFPHNRTYSSFGMIQLFRFEKHWHTKWASSFKSPQCDSSSLRGTTRHK